MLQQNQRVITDSRHNDPAGWSYAVSLQKCCSLLFYCYLDLVFASCLSLHKSIYNQFDLGKKRLSCRAKPLKTLRSNVHYLLNFSSLEFTTKSRGICRGGYVEGNTFRGMCWGEYIPLFCYCNQLLFQPRTLLLQSKPHPDLGNWRGVCNLIPSKNKEERAMWNIIFIIDPFTFLWKLKCYDVTSVLATDNKMREMSVETI